MPRSSLIACVLAACFPAASEAQSPPTPAADAREVGQSDIVVTGSRDRGLQIRRFIDAMAVPSRYRQLATYSDGVCPMAIGLRDEANRIVESRMRHVAAAAGIRLQKEGCAANAFLFVTDDKGNLIELLHQRARGLFGDMTDKQIRALAEENGKATAWQVAEPRGADGRLMMKVEDVELVKGRRARMDGYILPQVSVSRIGLKTRMDVVTSVVVIEAKALLGRSLMQVADYSALRLFAKTDPKSAAEQSAPTILALLDDRADGIEQPASLTQWDLSFLKSLYATRKDYSATQQQGNMARVFRRDLDEAAGGSQKKDGE